MGALQMGAQGTRPQLSTIAFNCRHFATKIPFTKGHESAQLHTIVHKLPRVALSPHLRAPIWTWVGLFYLRVCLFYLRLVFVAYGQLAWSFLLTVWSFLLTVEIRFGLFCLRFPRLRKLGLVFFAYGSPRPEIGFGLFCLRFPHCKWKRRTVSKKTSTVSKKDASFGLSRNFGSEKLRRQGLSISKHPAQKAG